MTTLQGRYEFIETLGTGATSRVDKARDTLIGRIVALKTFLHGFGSSDVQKQFLREAQIIGRLAHPYIVGLYDVGADSNGVPYFVMEYVEGKTLETFLDAGPLPLEKAVMWTTDLAAALARAHRAKVIHGDVKPANILVTKDGQVKLGDFGIARFATQVSTTGSLMGTPAYLSPEQIQGHTQDTRSDLFSLGIILYQMTTGVRPFNGSSVSAVCAQIVSITPLPPSHHNPSLPPAFDRVVMRCLAKEPADRYATAEALGASLYPFAGSNEAARVSVEAASAINQPMQRAQVWAASAVQTLSASMKDASRDFPATLARAFSSKSAWWNRPWQRRDLWAAGTAALVLISLVPIARALRNLAYPAQGTTKAATVPVASPMATNPKTRPPVTSKAAVLSVRSSQSMEHVGLNTDAGTSALNDISAEHQEEVAAAPVMTTPAFKRHAVTTAKSQTARPNSSKSTAGLKSGLPIMTPSTLDPSLVKAPPPAIAQTMLHIDIVSGVSDQTLAIYSGDELLLTTPLRPEHLGDTLRFNCPISASEHALRVVLYRGDKTVLLHKENNSELHADGTNNMQVRVNRRAKMLVKHETSLEVVWPSSTAATMLMNNTGFKSAGGLALR